MSLLQHRPRYLPLAFILWGGYLCVLYYIQFPFPFREAENPYLAFGFLGWVTLLAITTGATILRGLRLTYRSPAERLILSAAVGFGGIAYLVFALGLLHLLYPGVMYALLGLLTVISFREIKPTFETLRYYLTRAYALTASDLFPGALLLFLLGYHGLGTLVPPIFFDTLVYHLAMPKWYILQHGLTYCPYNFYSNFPFTIEMLYTLGLLVHGPILVKGLNYVIHLLMLAGLYSLARTYFQHRVALLSVIIFYTIPWVGITSFLIYIDIGLGCYFWLAMYAFLNWISRKETDWLWLCGLLTGVMLGIKYLAANGALIVGFSILGVLGWRARASWKARSEAMNLAGMWRQFQPILYFAVPAFLIGSPWYLKSWLWAGNPVYPFIFGGRDWDFARLQSYLTQYQLSPGIVHGNSLDFLRIPWHLVFPFESFDLSIGPILLIFLPLLLFFNKIAPLIKYFLVVSVVFLIGWVNSSQQFRFLIPVFPFLSVACAYTFSEGILNSARQWLRLLGWVTLCLCLLLNVLREMSYIHSTFAPFNVMMGLESKEAYLSRQLADLYPITQYANNHLPADAKLLYIGETRGYYADRWFIANTAEDKTMIVEVTHAASDAHDLRERLQALGITHIIFNRREATRLQREYQYFYWKTPEDQQKFEEFFRTHVHALHSINESDLLEIR